MSSEQGGIDVVGARDVPSEVVSAVRAMRQPVLIAHVVPDADALGAVLALAMALADDGNSRPSVALPPGSLSQRLAFMADWADVRIATARDFASADGFVVCDTAKKPRCNVDSDLKDTDWSAGRPVVNIDHHGTNTMFGDVNWVVDSAGSTCELMHALLVAAGLPISDVSASMLFAGIQTDTLGFTLPTTNAVALSACADLVRRGARVAQLGERLHRSQSRSEFDLLRLIYANTQVAAEGRIAYSTAGYDEIHEAGCRAADIDDQISVPRCLVGVELAMLFTEGHRGKTRINFRGEGDVTVIDLALAFGGGGHAQAAGAVLACGLAEAVAQVVPAAVVHLARFSR